MSQLSQAPSTNGRVPVKMPTARQYRDTQVDVKLVLCALWIAMIFVFAYVDIFGFYRADVLNAALDGKVATTSITVDQVFLTVTLIYILLPTLMVVLSLLLKPRVNRITNIVVSLVYVISIIVSCIGEHWAYYILGSAIEVMLLAAIARTAWRWPPPQIATDPSAEPHKPRGPRLDLAAPTGGRIQSWLGVRPSESTKGPPA
jgi:hypothetical protein